MDWALQDHVHYEVEMPGRRKEKKVYCVNLLKRWYPKEAAQLVLTASLEREEETDKMLGEFPLYRAGRFRHGLPVDGWDCRADRAPASGADVSV